VLLSLYIRAYWEHISPKDGKISLHLKATAIRIEVADGLVFSGILLLIKSWNLWSVNDSCQLTLENFVKSESAKLENSFDTMNGKNLDMLLSTGACWRYTEQIHLCKTQHKCSHANVPTSLRPYANSQTLTPKVLLNIQICQLPLVTRTIHIFTSLLDSKLFEELFSSTIFA